MLLVSKIGYEEVIRGCSVHYIKGEPACLRDVTMKNITLTRYYFTVRDYTTGKEYNNIDLFTLYKLSGDNFENILGAVFDKNSLPVSRLIIVCIDTATWKLLDHIDSISGVKSYNFGAEMGYFKGDTKEVCKIINNCNVSIPVCEYSCGKKVIKVYNGHIHKCEELGVVWKLDGFFFNLGDIYSLFDLNCDRVFLCSNNCIYYEFPLSKNIIRIVAKRRLLGNVSIN